MARRATKTLKAKKHPKRAKADARSLGDLGSIGPAMLEDFRVLGIASVSQLARQSAPKLFERLCVLTNSRQDPCVLDSFHCAIAQAKNPRLPAEQCQWWYWSKVRNAAASGKRSPRRPS